MGDEVWNKALEAHQYKYMKINENMKKHPYVFSAGSTVVVQWMMGSVGT